MNCAISLYFACIFSGRIDHANHENQVQKSMTEVTEFVEAIRTAAGMTSEDDNCIPKLKRGRFKAKAGTLYSQSNDALKPKQRRLKAKTGTV